MKTVKGIIMTLDHPNKNGRIYSSEMMNREIERFKQRLKDGEPVLGMVEPVLGMVGSSNGIYEQSNLQNVSHRLKNISVSEDNPNNVEGEFDILDTPQGKWLQAYLSENRIGCEVVGHGNVDPETHKVENYVLERIDILPKNDCAWEECELKEI